MRNYNKYKEKSCFQYLDSNYLYGWAMSQKLPVSGFKWKKFIKNYNEDSDKGYILEVDIKYRKNLRGLNEDLPF